MSKTIKARTWSIHGSADGFGRRPAEGVLKAGGNVVATARKREQIVDLEQQYPNAAKALALDVTKDDQVDSAVTQAFAQFGQVDVLVNNAGYGIAGAIEEATEAEFMPVFETNVFGLIRVTRAFLPYLRKQRSGHILNLSSIGGGTPPPLSGFYHTTKIALENLSAAPPPQPSPLAIHIPPIPPPPTPTPSLPH